MFCLCISTAYCSRSNPSDTVATISKVKIEEEASREEIAEKLANVWLRKYQIGTPGWMDWIWKYDIEKVEFWDSTAPCVNISFKVITVMPSSMTSWIGLYGKKDGIWIKNGLTMMLFKHEDYYELNGPYSLC